MENTYIKISCVANMPYNTLASAVSQINKKFRTEANIRGGNSHAIGGDNSIIGKIPKEVDEKALSKCRIYLHDGHIIFVDKIMPDTKLSPTELASLALIYEEQPAYITIPKVISYTLCNPKPFYTIEDFKNIEGK